MTLLDRPRIFLKATPVAGLRHLADLRAAILVEPAKSAWTELVRIAERDAGQPPLVPESMCPGRSPVQAAHGNPDFVIVNAVSRRVQYAALASLVTGEARFRDSALLQLEAVFDAKRWPDWRDKAHRHAAADLRTGTLCNTLSVAYDWLAPALSEPQRRWMVEGIDRCGIQPYLKAVREKAGFIVAQNNWTTCVVGGLGIAGMALGEDHPQSRELIDFAIPRMESYLEQFGPEGEFNESVGYSNATILAVEFFLALRYGSGGGDNRLARAPFPQFGRWLRAMTLPPGRLAALGDSQILAAPQTVQCAAIAAAARDGLLQGFFAEYPEPANERRDLVKNLLWPDPSVPAESPDGKLPKARVYAGHGMVFSSRSDWDSRAAASVVYGKGGCGKEMHGHHDAGQVCLDGFGKRLIVDSGNPSNYPADFFGPDRWRYHNAAAWGHNVLTFDGADQRPDAEAKARWVASAFNEERGGFWTLDLTGNYDGVTRVRRTMIHLLPAVVAVLDEADLPAERLVCLRWHTADRAEPAADGRFAVVNEGVRLAGLVARLDGGALALRRGEHVYEAPFDRGRLGELLDQRRESYIEAAAPASRIKLLTLFAIAGPGEAECRWSGGADRWSLNDGCGEIAVTWVQGELIVTDGTRRIGVKTGDS